MFWNKKGQKKVNVAASDKYVIWNVDVADVEYDTEVCVEPGCAGIYIVNGAMRPKLAAGSVYLINSKKERKDIRSIQLLGVMEGKTFTIHCGVGGVPFKDNLRDRTTTVGAHGDCQVNIFNGWMLYTTLGKKDITAEDVDEYVRGKLSELMTTELALVLQHYNYHTVTSEQSHIADELKYKFEEKLEAVGLQLTSFALKKIFFSDEYVNSIKADEEKEKEMKEAKRERREQERRQNAEIDALKSLAEISMSSAGSAPQPQPQQPQFTVCPKCGSKVDSRTLYCPACGKKL